MKTLQFILAAVAIALMATSCASPNKPAVDNAVTRTGQNLKTAVSEVMQDYADVKANGVSSLWSISKGLNAYSTIVKTTADIKQVMADWKATQGDTFVNRVLRVLNESDAPPQTKALVVASAAEQVAANKGP